MTSMSSLSLSWPGHAVATGSEVNQTVACLPRHWGRVAGWGCGGVLPVGVTMSVIPPPHSRLSLVNNSSDIPLETLWHYGCPFALVRVGILLANKGINSQGILGISFFLFFLKGGRVCWGNFAPKFFKWKWKWRVGELDGNNLNYLWQNITIHWKRFFYHQKQKKTFTFMK